MNLDKIWVEKYRPKTIDELIVEEDIKSIVRDFGKNEQIPNLLFVGSPGTGKTSLAKILVHDVLKCNYLYINASDENGIDTIRTKVIGFAQTRGFTETVKVVILDEADGLSPDSQKALRNVMESFITHTRFILTANYNHKIIEPIRSRCQRVDLTFTVKDVTKRITDILDKEKVEYTIDTVNEIVKKSFPDMRVTINKIQRSIVDGKLVLDKTGNSTIVANLYLLLLKNHVLKARQYMIQKQDTFNNDYQKLLKDLFDYIDEQPIKDSAKKLALICIHEHIYKGSFVADYEINAYVCLIALSNILLSDT